MIVDVPKIPWNAYLLATFYWDLEKERGVPSTLGLGLGVEGSVRRAVGEVRFFSESCAHLVFFFFTGWGWLGWAVREGRGLELPLFFPREP